MTQLNNEEGATQEGFTGTVQGFLAWLKENLSYGGVVIGEPEQDPHIASRSLRQVQLITAGYSEDEALLGRVSRSSMFFLRFWESTHRGGLDIYHVPLDCFDSDNEVTWLEPATEVFESVYRARTVVVSSSDDQTCSFDFPNGVELSFSEPARDLADPAGVLTLQHLEPLDIFKKLL